MADRTSLRSSNRRNTPQSPPKSTTSTNPQHPATRVTRSQSHNVSDSETGRTAGRGGRRGRTRQASEESVQSIESRTSPAGKRTKPGVRAKTANGMLTTRSTGFGQTAFYGLREAMASTAPWTPCRNRSCDCGMKENE